MGAVARIPPRSPVDVRREANELTVIEQMVYDICVQCADAGVQLLSNEEITQRIGSHGTGSTVAGILGRLAMKGRIKHDKYQRGRQVTIIASGRQTAPPNNTAPHWRLRVENAPAVAIQSVRQRSYDLAQLIEMEARMLGKALPDFLCDLTYIGWHAYQAEKESAR